MNKHEYLVEIQRYFSGSFRFQVTAENKSEALNEAKKSKFYRDSNTISDSIKVIKKLKPSFGGNNNE